MLQGIKAVFLDIDNTLLDFNACSRLSMEKGFADFGLSFAPEMYDAFKRVNDGLWLQIEKETLTRCELHRTRWGLVFKELGIQEDGEAFEQRFLYYLAREAVAIDGAHELLSYLYPRYIVCAASNAPYEQQLKRLETVNMLHRFHQLFISEKMGVTKPSKAFFDACFAQLSDVRPEETIMIGDSVTADIRGGGAYGMHTCWYDHHRSGGSCEEAEYSVSSLLEIKELL